MSRTGRHVCGRIIVRMTRRQTRLIRNDCPIKSPAFAGDMLRPFAWLVTNIVSTLGAILKHRPRDWHTDAESEDLLPTSNDFPGRANIGPPGSLTLRRRRRRRLEGPAVDARRRNATLHDQFATRILRDDRRSAPIPQDEVSGLRYECTEALMLRDRCKASIVSKHGGVLTALSALVPTNVGTQGEWQTLSGLAAQSPHPQRYCSWIPTPVGMSGAKSA